MKPLIRIPVISISILFFTVAAASAMTIKFNDQTAGTIIENQYASHFTVLGHKTGVDENRAMIFDSQNPTGQDPDLLTPGALGNASGDQLEKLLIISEDGDSSDPDDNAGTGYLEFYFAYDITSFGFHLIDIEGSEANGYFAAFYHDDTQLGSNVLFSSFVSRDGAVFGNNSVNRIDPVLAADLGGTSFDKVRIHFKGSGAVDNLVFTPVVPEPATMLLLGTGLVGLAGARRKRKK